jgi:hypothetical protein
MSDLLWLWAIPALPLAGSAINGLLYLLSLPRRTASAAHGAAHAHDAHAAHAAGDAHGEDEHAHAGPVGVARLAGIVGCGVMALALALAIKGFFDLQALDASQRVLESPVWHWIAITGFNVDLSMVLDPLSSALCLVICGVGFLIHVYSDHIRYFQIS